MSSPFELLNGKKEQRRITVLFIISNIMVYSIQDKNIQKLLN